jgi:ZIP family zinc transporter
VHPLLYATVAFASTAAGGLFAIRYRQHLHLILGFTAGVVLGVVGFDLLPEIFQLTAEYGVDPVRPMVALVGGFLLFHAVEKLLLIHRGQETSYAHHHHPDVGLLSALALVGHSFVDGMGIGLAFQVSPRIGLVVATAVIAHDFADGLNTVGLMLAHQNTHRRALGMLALDALAPLAGAASTLLVQLPAPFLPLYLGFFAGFLLYIGAADILPEAHSHRSSALTIALTCLGAAFVFVVTRFAD